MNIMQNKQPPQPDKSNWTFIHELQTPLHRKIKLPFRGPVKNGANLSEGVHVQKSFNDPQGVLETAYLDFRCFLKAAGIKMPGPYPVIIRQIKTEIPEEHIVQIGKNQCEILANDTEGIRRGLILLENEILKRRGPFLPPGTIHCKPVIRTRVSRCCFSPGDGSVRPQDAELTDEVNYYPDEYLNRLAHDGVNALWIKIKFRDTVPSKIIPEYGVDAARRLAKLQRTVEQCGRYGIKIYPLCIEPAPFSTDSPILAAHPELGGHRSGNTVYFCVSSQTGREYVEEAVRNLFSAVPKLGGLIVISVGEAGSHCYSFRAEGINCPRCSKRKPWEVMADTMAAMERGMHAINPEAELISWPYGQFWYWDENLIPIASAHVPKGNPSVIGG